MEIKIVNHPLKYLFSLYLLMMFAHTIYAQDYDKKSHSVTLANGKEVEFSINDYRYEVIKLYNSRFVKYNSSGEITLTAKRSNNNLEILFLGKYDDEDPNWENQELTTRSINQIKSFFYNCFKTYIYNSEENVRVFYNCVFEEVIFKFQLIVGSNLKEYIFHLDSKDLLQAGPYFNEYEFYKIVHYSK